MLARCPCCLTAAALALAMNAVVSRADDDAALAQEAAAVTVAIDVAFPAAAVEAPGGEVDEDARLAPIRAQYEPLLKSGLSFANRVCGFSDEQRQQAIAAGVKWLDEFARGQVAGNQNQRGGLLVFWAAAQPQRPADPVVAAESQIADVVRSVLTDDQKREYESQLAQRAAFGRQAIIDNLIAKMDEHMDLSVEQREKLTKTLLARWDENWAPPLETFVQMSQYMPAIPDEFVTPHLSDEQKRIWSGLQKVSFGRENFGMMDVFGGGAVIDDIILKDSDLKDTE
jgi:hypothetical protein